MAGHLRLGGGLAQGLEEQLAHPHWLTAKAQRAPRDQGDESKRWMRGGSRSSDIAPVACAPGSDSRVQLLRGASRSSVSMMSVTGPSLVRVTCMCWPKAPRA